MKTSKLSRAQLGMILVVSSLAPSVGCKSTSWKMPGSSFFSSNREPDAATLAGSGNLPQMPEGPASKYTPTSLASKSSAPGSQPTSNTGAYGSDSTNSYSGQTVSTPTAGLAAQANGYQTGPYQVASTSPGTLPSSTPKTGSAGGSYPSAYSSAGGSGMPNPYGGSYAGVSSGNAPVMPEIALPKSISGELASQPSAKSAYAPGVGSTVSMPTAYPTGSPYASANSATTTPGYPSASSNRDVGVQTPSTNQYPGIPSTGTVGGTANSAYTSSNSNYPPIPNMNSTLPTAPSGGSSNPSYPTASTTMPSGTSGGVSNAVAGGSSASGQQGSATQASYAPGTTGRNTTYNFGSSGSSQAGSSSSGASSSGNTSTPTSGSLLPPNTASGAYGPGSQLLR